MSFKQTILESCAAVPAMGNAAAKAWTCIFEADATQPNSTQVQNGGATENSLPLDPAALTENPEGAKVLANIANKASQEKQQVDAAQAKLDQTTAAAGQAIGELQSELNAKETLNEQNQQQIANAQG